MGAVSFPVGAGAGNLEGESRYWYGGMWYYVVKNMADSRGIHSLKQEIPRRFRSAVYINFTVFILFPGKQNKEVGKGP